MRASQHNRIITKNVASRRIDWWHVGIVVLGLCLRLYRLPALAEFLGDQGRTMLVLHAWIADGMVPLVGPTTLTGHHLGPVFYYLLLPGYLLSGGSPVGVSLWMALLGSVSIAVLYALMRDIRGAWSARAVTILWAVSPQIISADRVIWEPNLVPLFALLYIFLLYRAHREQKTWYWLGTGAAAGVLVQLHYPDVIFIGLTGVYFLGALLRKPAAYKSILRQAFWSALGFAVIISPFVWHEREVGFVDITGISSVIGGGVGRGIGKRMMIWYGLDYSSRVLGRMLPFMTKIAGGVLLAVWAVYWVLRRTKLLTFVALWFGIGIIAMARFPGVVHDHYLYFLLPVPFIVLGIMLSSLTSKTGRRIAGLCVFIVCLYQLTHTDMFRPGYNDVERVHLAVQHAQKIVKDTPFSFTIIGSRSFSDLHYRYYMHAMGLSPLSVTSNDYQTLLIFCDGQECTHQKGLAKTERLQVMCYDPHCSGYYPTLAISRDWVFLKGEDVRLNGNLEGKIYVFSRKMSVDLDTHGQP